MAVVDENGHDPTMGVNNFGEVKILSKTDTVCRNLLLVLFGKPGFYPSQPELGIDIAKYFYTFDDIDLSQIKADLEVQCSKLVPEIDSLDFQLHMTEYNGQGMLIIRFPVIRTDDRLYMALGITTNRRGEFMYKFVEDKNQLI
jgi:hypothetical protein